MDGNSANSFELPVPADIGRLLDAESDDEERRRLIGRWLDGGRAIAQAFWSHVAERNGLSVGNWKFIADPKHTQAILRDPIAFSVAEYDRRMSATSGRFFLGMDGAEHRRDAALGEIIPSWNDFTRPPAPDPYALAQVIAIAEGTTRAVLEGVAGRAQLARETHCQIKVAELLAPVLDACAARFFGVPGPSAASLITWAKDVTAYHFRVHATDALDRSPASSASGQFHAHVLSLVAALSDPPSWKYGPESADALRRCVTLFRERLRACPHAPVSDGDVVRNLIGIMTGSLTATLKAFLEAIMLLPREASTDRILWPELAPCVQPLAACPCGHALSAAPELQLDFSRYEAVVARPLAKARRGSLDAIYRRYEGVSGRKVGALTLNTRDLVIVWLGGTLGADPDNVFGIGVHKCPGMDMGKAVLQGVLNALMRLQPAPARKLFDGDPTLVFELTALA